MEGVLFETNGYILDILSNPSIFDEVPSLADFASFLKCIKSNRDNSSFDELLKEKLCSSLHLSPEGCDCFLSSIVLLSSVSSNSCSVPKHILIGLVAAAHYAARCPPKRQLAAEWAQFHSPPSSPSRDGKTLELGSPPASPPSPVKSALMATVEGGGAALSLSCSPKLFLLALSGGCDVIPAESVGYLSIFLVATHEEIVRAFSGDKQSGDDVHIEKAADRLRACVKKPQEIRKRCGQQVFGRVVRKVESGRPSSPGLEPPRGSDQKGKVLCLRDIHRTTCIATQQDVEKERHDGVRRKLEEHLDPASEHKKIASFNFPDVAVRDISDCTVYLLFPIRSLLLSGVHNSTIVCPAVEVVIRVEKCERCQVIGSTRMFWVSSSLDITSYVHTTFPPAIMSGSRSIIFAPFNIVGCSAIPFLVRAIGLEGNYPEATFPSQCPAHFKYATLAADVPEVHDLWARARVFPKEIRSVVTLLPPQDFFPFAIPFSSPLLGFGDDGTSDSGGTAFPLSESYAEAVDDKKRRVTDIRGKVSEVSENKETQQRVFDEIQSKFKEWLVSSGNMRQIHDLVRLEEVYKKEQLTS
mmetsp:Transcript_7254/g.18839  ORF Transcript_7254/g.18839 Transcript_7254/m.18839 type:complete len:582 (-) Transcript_7254:1079-2824(-)